MAKEKTATEYAGQGGKYKLNDFAKRCRTASMAQLNGALKAYADTKARKATLAKELKFRQVVRIGEGVRP